MIITTAFDETPKLIEKAKHLARQLQIDFVRRNKKTLKYLHENNDHEIFVVNSRRGLSFHKYGCEEIFFHPNMAFHRIKQISRGQSDSLIAACELKENMSFLDCTLGLASDTLVASYVIGNGGCITSLEKSFVLATIVKEGLYYYAKHEAPEYNELIKNLNIINSDNLDYLKTLPNDSVDIVYFDFMFTKTVETSQGIKVIKPIVSYDLMTEEHVREAIRVAKAKVVVKSNYGNEKISEYGFEIMKKNQKRHFFYGVIEIDEHKYV